MMNRCRSIKKVLVSIIGMLFLFSAETMIPVKQSATLRSFEPMHIRMAEISMQTQCGMLEQKLRILDRVEEHVLAIEAQLLEKIERLGVLGAEVPSAKYLETTTKTAVQPLLSKIAAMYQKITEETKIGPKIVKTTHDNFRERLLIWKQKLIGEIMEGVTVGHYTPLFASLPSEFFLDVHIPNTFLCAFSFFTESGKIVNVFVNDASKDCPSSKSDVERDAIFMSGVESGELAGVALLVQITAIGGEIPTEKTKILSGPQDLFRHSEQVSFKKMSILDFIDSLIVRLESIEKDAIKDIIFHGHTHRDMCPNCRSTLVAHSMHACRNTLYPDAIHPNSFLCLLQNKCAEKFGKKPIVTCLISSFLEYTPRIQTNGWDLEPPVNPLNLSQRGGTGIIPTFVNQFAFPEAEFLAMFKKFFPVDRFAGNPIVQAIMSKK